MGRLAPRNESEFVSEIREGLMDSLPGLVRFDRVHSISGMPDAHVQFLAKQTLIVLDDFWVEFKYLPKPCDALPKIWDLLRGVQKSTIIRMTKAGERVFLCVCYGGVEASWFLFNKEQMKKVEEGKAEPWTILALLYQSVRRSNGRWSTGQDWGDIDEGPRPKSLRDLGLIKSNGLIKP